jgi:hypothetical protein
MGAIDDSTRQQQIKSNMLYSRYNDFFDRDSAFEFLERMKQTEEGGLTEQQGAAAEAEIAETTAKGKKSSDKKAEKPDKNSPQYQVKKAAKSVASTTAGTVGREIGKTVGKTVGGKFGKTLGGNVGAQLGRSIMGVLFKS